MARRPKKYRRLPGSSLSLISSQKLWQGPDHLLWVETTMYLVRYKRFKYSDIQAIVLRRSNDHQVWSFIWGVFALLFGVVALTASGTPYVSGTLTLIFLLSLALNLAMGPACRVHLQTAVQVQRLRSLKRVRTAAKAMDRIGALVEKVQGAVQSNPSHPAQSTTVSTAPNAISPAAQSEPAAPQGPFKPLVHRVLFGSMVAAGLIGFIQMGLKSLSIAVIQVLLHAVVQIVAIAALVRWYRHIKKTQVGLLSWISLTVAVLYTLAGYAIYIAAMIRHPDMTYAYWEILKVCFELVYWDHPTAQATRIVIFIATLIPAIMGLLALGRSKKTQSAPGQGRKDA